MKLIYDEHGRLSEILGTGENGDFTDNEEKIVAKFIESEKEMKLKSFEENRIIQVEIAKNQSEMSRTSSQTYGKFWDALGSLAVVYCHPDQPQPNQLPQNTQPQVSQSEKK